jgi:uncharacterized membrane protein
LKIVAVISVLGLSIVTLGTVFLSIIERSDRTPVPFFFALGGLAAIILICRYLMRMIQPARSVMFLAVQYVRGSATTCWTAATNRQLSRDPTRHR